MEGLESERGRRLAEHHGIDTFVPEAYVPSQDAHLSGVPTWIAPLYVHRTDVERVRRVIENKPGLDEAKE